MPRRRPHRNQLTETLVIRTVVDERGSPERPLMTPSGACRSQEFLSPSVNAFCGHRPDPCARRADEGRCCCAVVAALRHRLADRGPARQRPAGAAHPGRPAPGRTVPGGHRHRDLRPPVAPEALHRFYAVRIAGGLLASSRPCGGRSCPRARMRLKSSAPSRRRSMTACSSPHPVDDRYAGRRSEARTEAVRTACEHERRA